MGFLQNQNLTLSISQPEVTHWESSPQLSSTVHNSIIVLGMLTFALQLCLVLFFMLRCWSYENRVREALKGLDTVQKLWIVPSNFQQHADKHGWYPVCGDNDAASPISLHVPAKSAAATSYKELQVYETATNFQSAPFIHWDLVQC
ncbi:hypothetical protein LDENG_00176150 [Lucifuga dentata]|nr:hypothetical protein LDENG_00176150 [Lucifuga dentata]